MENNTEIQEKSGYTKEQKNTVLVAVVTSFITTFMGSALNLSVPDIEAEFGVSASAVGWVITVYMLTCAALAVPFGRIADMLQRKTILWLGILIFALSSALAVVTWSMAMLLVFRFIQGVGASMIFSTNIAILIGAFDDSQRGKVLGYSTSATYVGLSAGPVLGGILNHNFGWRSIFIAAAVVSAVALYSAIRKLPRSEKTHLDKSALDIQGNLFYVGAVVAMMYGLSTIMDSIIGPAVLAAGVVLLILFVRRELKASTPVVNVRIFKKNTAYAFSNIAALLNYGATFAISYLISIYLQVIMGYSSQTAGIILIASPVVMAVLSPVMGRLSDKHSPYIMSSVGMGLCACALILFSFLSERAPLWAVIAILALSGLGFAMFSSPNTNAVMASVEKEDYGVASSILATMRSIGHTTSMAIVTVIVGVFLGTAGLATAEPQILMKTMHTCFYVFTGLCFAGIFIALKRKS